MTALHEFSLKNFMINHSRVFMSSRRILRRMAFAGACTLAAQMAAAQEISAAEALLFQARHLQNIHEPMALTYTYKKDASAESSFDDEVHLDVNQIKPDGGASVSMRFLSGSRKMDIPNIGDAQGNPALLGFLERDIVEMKRLTGGSSNYFRKRIRLALAEAAQMRQVNFSYEGKQVAGQEVSIQPYLNDPMRERFEKYLNKRYVFILSSQVPGGIYQVRSSLSGGQQQSDAAAQDKLRMDETLTLIKAQKPGKGTPVSALLQRDRGQL